MQVESKQNEQHQTQEELGANLPSKSSKIEKPCQAPCATYKMFNEMSPLASKWLEEFGFQKKSNFPDFVLVRSANMHGNNEILKSLAVARAGIGVDNIPIAKLTENLIPVFFAPGGNSDSVAEFTFLKILEAAKKSAIAIQFTKSFTGKGIELESIKKRFGGFQLRGKSISVLGSGSVGTKVALICSDIGMKVCVNEILLQENNLLEVEKRMKSMSCTCFETVERILDMIHQTNPRRRILAGDNIQNIDKTLNEGDIFFSKDHNFAYQSDFVSIHTGHQPKPFFDADFFSKCKKGIIVINTDRLSLVDENALLNALENGIVSQYHTDFAPENLKLREHMNVFPTPHIAASTQEAEDLCAKMVTMSTLSYFFNGNVANSRNFPQIIMNRKGKTRISLLELNKSEGPKELDESYVKKMIGSRNLTILQTKIVENQDVSILLVDIEEEIDDSLANEFLDLTENYGLKCRILKRNPKFEQFEKENESLLPQF